MEPQATLNFASDYLEGAHPAILDALVRTNLEQTPGYGTDAHCKAAREAIRAACTCPLAEVHFIVGGTQANALLVSTLLAPFEGVIAADTGHIATHEAGAIEAGGHKVLCLPHHQGKIDAAQVDACAARFWDDGNREHMVAPGMVYLSQPTEYGTLYTLAELEAMRAACDCYGMRLYVDGARLAYGLASPTNDVTLPDLARLCDAFYIGGTKCGALIGEAVVFPKPRTIPHFFTLTKQHGALLAKGRVLGIQFEQLFSHDLYTKVGRHALEQAQRITDALVARGYRLYIQTPTNQIFPVLSEEQYERLSTFVEMSFWERLENGDTVVRIATSWATKPEDVDALIALL